MSKGGLVITKLVVEMDLKYEIGIWIIDKKLILINYILYPVLDYHDR